MESKLIYQGGSDTIRQMPQNYLIAHYRENDGWISNPDLAADLSLCVKVYRTIIHSWANKYSATGAQIVDMANKL